VNCFVPGIIGHLDLPDLAALVAPRALFVVEPLDGAKKRVAESVAAETYGLAARICREAGKPANLVLRASASDEDLVELLTGWYNRAV